MKTGSARRMAATTVAAFGLTALLAPSAGAASMPPVLSGEAKATALTVTVSIPSLAELRSALIAAGYPVSALPSVDILDDTLSLVVASTDAQSTHSPGTTDIDAMNVASGWAAPLLGKPVSAPKSQTRCDTTSCANSVSVAKDTIVLPAPLDLGKIDIAGAHSSTTSYFDTVSETGLIDVDLSMGRLIGSGAPLAAIGTALDQVRTAVNSNVVPPLNDSIDTVNAALNGVAPLQPLKRELDRIITVDHIKPLPDLRTVDLVTGRVLGSHSSLADATRANVTGLQAKAESQIVNLEVLGGWASIDSIHVLAEAYANGIKGKNDATSVSNTDIVNASLGGLLGIHVSAADLEHLLDPATLKGVVRDTLPPAASAAVDEIAAAIDIIYNVSNVTLERLSSSKLVSPAGVKAQATSNSLRLRVAPQIPNFAKLTAAGAGVPRLAKSDYTPSGLVISIDLPSASAAVAATNVLPVCIGSCVPITGVEHKVLFGLMLLGLAIGVRRYALSR